MKEVFEKIIERLEGQKGYYKDIRKNTYCRVTETSECDSCRADHYLDARLKCIDDSIEIVKKEAEQYNNGWILCSDRFPKVEDLHEKSVDDCTCYLIQRRCGIMDVAHYIKVYGEPYFEANSIKMKDVVAWHPLPEPYNPKGE